MSHSQVFQYGVCWCGSPIEGKPESLRLWVAGEEVTEPIAHGVCPSCGFTYYKVDIFEAIEALVSGNRRERPQSVW